MSIACRQLVFHRRVHWSQPSMGRLTSTPLHKNRPIYQTILGASVAQQQHKLSDRVLKAREKTEYYFKLQSVRTAAMDRQLQALQMHSVQRVSSACRARNSSNSSRGWGAMLECAYNSHWIRVRQRERPQLQFQQHPERQRTTLRRIPREHRFLQISYPEQHVQVHLVQLAPSACSRGRRPANRPLLLS